MATTATFQTLAEDIINEMDAGKDPRVFVATGGAVGTIIDTAHIYTSDDANRFDGVNAYVVAGTGNQVTRITRAGFAPTTGTWTVSPDLGAAPTSKTVWFMHGYTRNDILQAANRAQANIFGPAYLPLSLITDGDMEASGVTNWTDAVGTPTQSKETTIVLTGRQSLKIVTTTVDHAVTSANLPVTENETLNVIVPVKVTAGSLRVSVWNATAGAEITNGGATIDEEAWTEARLQVTVPDNCQNVAIRLVAKTAATTAYVDFVSVLSGQRDIISLPSSIPDASYVESIHYTPVGLGSEANYSYLSLAERLQPWPHWDFLRDWRGVNSLRVEIHSPGLYPLFVMFRRPMAAFSADSDTTEAPELLVVEGALSELKRELGNKWKDNDLLRQAMGHARNFHAMLDNLGLGRPIMRRADQYRVSAPSHL